MKETEVKRLVADHLDDLFRNYDFESHVDYGEIGVAKNIRADVVCYINRVPQVGIECKCEQGSFRKAIGQAATYRSAGLMAGVAIPGEPSEFIKRAVLGSNLRLFCVENGIVREYSETPLFTDDEIDVERRLSYLERRIKYHEEFCEMG